MSDTEGKSGFVHIHAVLEASRTIAANILGDEVSLPRCLELARVVHAILTSPNQLVRPMVEALISGAGEAAAHERTHDWLDNATRVAWNIAGNVGKSVLGQDISFEDRVTLAEAVVSIGFSTHAHTSKINAFFRQDPKNQEKARVYEELDDALRLALKQTSEHLGPESPLLAFYAKEILSISFAPHAPAEMRAMFLRQSQ